MLSLDLTNFTIDEWEWDDPTQSELPNPKFFLGWIVSSSIKDENPKIAPIKNASFGCTDVSQIQISKHAWRRRLTKKMAKAGEQLTPEQLQKKLDKERSMLVPKKYGLDIDEPLPGQTNHFEVQLCLYRVFNRKQAQKLKSFFINPASTFQQLDQKITNIHQDNLDKFMKKFSDVGSAVSKIPMPPISSSLQVLNVVPDIIQLGANTKEMMTLQPLLWETTKVCGSIKCMSTSNLTAATAAMMLDGANIGTLSSATGAGAGFSTIKSNFSNHSNGTDHLYQLKWNLISNQPKDFGADQLAVTVPWEVKKRYTACPRHSLLRHKKNGSTTLLFSVSLIDQHIKNSINSNTMPESLQKIFTPSPNQTIKMNQFNLQSLKDDHSQGELHLSDLPTNIPQQNIPQQQQQLQQQRHSTSSLDGNNNNNNVLPS